MGVYYPLPWVSSGSGRESAPAHFVTGHVSLEQFREAVDVFFGESPEKPVVPLDAKLEHACIRTVLSGDASMGRYETRFTAPGRGAKPVTYWEIRPFRLGYT